MSKGSKKKYSFEIVDRCESQYVEEGKTFDEIAKQEGISPIQVKRWGKKYEWKRKKEEFRQRSMKAQEETRALMREEILLQDLVNQKNLLDEYFKGREYDKSDFNTYSLYRDILNGIAKLLADIRRRDQTVHELQKADRPQAFLGFMRDQIVFLQDRHPDMVSAFETIFDEYADWAKQKYS